MALDQLDGASLERLRRDGLEHEVERGGAEDEVSSCRRSAPAARATSRADVVESPAASEPPACLPVAHGPVPELCGLPARSCAAAITASCPTVAAMVRRSSGVWRAASATIIRAVDAADARRGWRCTRARHKAAALSSAATLPPAAARGSTQWKAVAETSASSARHADPPSSKPARSRTGRRRPARPACRAAATRLAPGSMRMRQRVGPAAPSFDIPASRSDLSRAPAGRLLAPPSTALPPGRLASSPRCVDPAACLPGRG